MPITHLHMNTKPINNLIYLINYQLILLNKDTPHQ